MFIVDLITTITTTPFVCNEIKIRQSVQSCQAQWNIMVDQSPTMNVSKVAVLAPLYGKKLW